MKSSILISHPTGNANLRAAAQGLAKNGSLRQFYTSIACFPNTTLSNIAGFSVFSEIKRRSFDLSLKEYTHTYPIWEIGRLLSLKFGFKSLSTHEVGMFSIDNVCHKLDYHVSKNLLKALHKGVNGLYAYEDTAAKSFAAAKELNIKCFFEQPIGYWRAAKRILQQEIDLRPEWANTIVLLKDSEEKLKYKDSELALADHIFAASSFTATTLLEYPGKLAAVSVIPYGFSPVKKREYTNPKSRPLKVLFVGGLSQRKGVANVFEAVDHFGDNINLTVVGRKTGEICFALDEYLKKHVWIETLPHEDILALMRANDVFIFPSLFEGFGLVITEAMSQGTPVITTNRTCGPDFIDDGESGWLTEASSTEKLIEKLDKIMTNPGCISVIGKSAMDIARKRPWAIYGQELADKIENLYL